MTSHRRLAALSIAAAVLLGLGACDSSALDPPTYLAVRFAGPPKPWTPAPTTTTPPPPVTRPPRAARARPAPRSIPSAAPATGDVWVRLSRCESHGNLRAVGGGGRFFGAFQFVPRTWWTLDHPPATWSSWSDDMAPAVAQAILDATWEVQLDHAIRNQRRGGWRQWPHCSRVLGLR